MCPAISSSGWILPSVCGVSHLLDFNVTTFWGLGPILWVGQRLPYCPDRHPFLDCFSYFKQPTTELPSSPTKQSLCIPLWSFVKVALVGFSAGRLGHLWSSVLLFPLRWDCRKLFSSLNLWFSFSDNMSLMFLMLVMHKIAQMMSLLACCTLHPSLICFHKQIRASISCPPPIYFKDVQ